MWPLTAIDYPKRRLQFSNAFDFQIVPSGRSYAHGGTGTVQPPTWSRSPTDSRRVQKVLNGLLLTGQFGSVLISLVWWIVPNSRLKPMLGEATPHVPRLSAFGVEDLSTNLQWLGWALGIPASCVEFKNDQKWSKLQSNSWTGYTSQ